MGGDISVRQCAVLDTLDVSGDGVRQYPPALERPRRSRANVDEPPSDGDLLARPACPRLNEQCINELLKYRWSSSWSTTAATTAKGQFNLLSPVTGRAARSAHAAQSPSGLDWETRDESGASIHCIMNMTKSWRRKLLVDGRPSSTWRWLQQT